MAKKVWECKIGFAEDVDLPQGADLPLREAVAEAFVRLFKKQPDFCFSGWGGKLTPAEREYANEIKASND
jgi:hypothetical protein